MSEQRESPSESPSSDDPTQTGEFGPMPTPQVEPGETSPGGPDSVALPDEVVAADLDPEKNPATEASPAPVKDSLEEGEDTATEATESDGSDESSDDTSEETPA